MSENLEILLNILPVITISIMSVLFLTGELMNRNPVSGGNKWELVPVKGTMPSNAYTYYTENGVGVYLSKKGRTFRAYLTDSSVLPVGVIRRDRYGSYVETGCTTENQAESAVDRMFE